MIYSLDTNIFVDALRQPAEMERLKTFLSWALPATVLSSIVATELAAGARTDVAQRVLDQSVLDPFDRRGRILAPSAAAWRRTGVLLAKSAGARVTASRQNDTLLAAQARERGWTLVTRDRDFWKLRASIGGLQLIAPYPDRR